MNTQGFSARQIIFSSPRQVDLAAVTLPSLGHHDVLVKTRYSLISNGTERTAFLKDYAPGTHWDRWITYPFRPGYAFVGEIVSGGVEARLNVGRRVVGFCEHASHHVIDFRELFVVPDKLDDLDACWFALSKVAFVGVKAAEVRPGDNVLVVGAGPLGQMVCRWASLGGGVLTVVSRHREQLEAIKPAAAIKIQGDFCELVHSRATPLGRGSPQTIIDCTGDQKVLPAALTTVADGGRVVLLGDPGDPAKLKLTWDVVRRSLTIVGAHGTRGDALTINSLFFDRAVEGALDMTALHTRTFAPEDCKQAYDFVCDRTKPKIGVAFRWAQADGVGHEP